MKMMKSISLLIYLAFCCSAIQGSSPGPDASPVVNQSSPIAHNVTADQHQLYSEWSEWTGCSATCGLGIITRTRACLKSAYNSRGVYVPLCHAEYSEHKICSLKKCPPDAPRARAVQCAQHNNRTVAGKTVGRWIPAEGGPNPCELRCKAETGGVEYGFGKVSNGTPCPEGVCLDGRCLRIGCDDRLGSDVLPDMCGVCGGRNASCVHYKDVFMGQPTADKDRRNGYQEVVVLPIGSRNLIIRQIVGKNYLALQDRTRGIIFNGEQHLTQYGGHYDIAGTRVQFEKSDNTTEILTAKGPVTEELYVLVLLRTFNQGIYYEYWLPKQTRPHHTPSARNSHYAAPIRQATTQTPTRHAHRPTKPAFAYGYGEKPYKSADAPVFRHHYYGSTTTTTKAPLIGVYPKKDVQPQPMYVPRVHRLPPGGYYQMFRNATWRRPTETVSQKVLDLDKELPALTQPAIHDTVIPNTVLLDEKKKGPPKSPKKPPRPIGVIKRGGDVAPIANGRLKYSVQEADGVYVNSSGRQAPAPLSIALLPPQESKKGGRRTEKTRPNRGGSCPPCERSRDQTKHFCESDFVIRGLVLGYEFVQGETRYELEVKQTFKNTLSLLPREYVWSPDSLCRCPKLRPGKEYVIMGRIDNNYRKRESRLLVDKTCFVRTFSLKYARRLQKLRKERTKKCDKTS